MNLNRERYRAIAIVLTIGGTILAAWFAYLNVTSTSYVLTLGPQQNKIYVNSGVPFYTVMVVLFGVILSVGLSMILNLHPPDK